MWIRHSYAEEMPSCTYEQVLTFQWIVPSALALNVDIFYVLFSPLCTCRLLNQPSSSFFDQCNILTHAPCTLFASGGKSIRPGMADPSAGDMPGPGAYGGSLTESWLVASQPSESLAPGFGSSIARSGMHRHASELCVNQHNMCKVT